MTSYKRGHAFIQDYDARNHVVEFHIPCQLLRSTELQRLSLNVFVT